MYSPRTLQKLTASGSTLEKLYKPQNVHHSKQWLDTHHPLYKTNYEINIHIRSGGLVVRVVEC
jgi:hypothetical protein